MSVAPDFTDATDVARRVGARERSAEEEVERALERLAALDSRLGAIERRLEPSARERARALDRALDAGLEPPPLAGVPLLIKANMCLEGAPASCGSRLLAEYRAPYTASFLARATDAGAIPVGIAHMDEFAMGSSGENCALGTTRNPWDLSRAPGGSSSGCAAAVAAGLVPLALGSDTGGSVRQPASFCGISGFKPTYGRIPRHGLVAFGSSLDQVSPLARSVRDLELVYAVLAGEDARDATSLAASPEPEPSDGNGASLDGLRIGLVEELSRDALDGALDAGVEACVRLALDALVARGATLVPVSLPRARHALSAYYVVAAAEASSNLARYDGVRYGRRVEGDGSLDGMLAATRTAGFGDEVKRRILLGTFVLSAGYRSQWYGKANAVRAALARDFARAFESVDLIACPTSPTTAFPLGARRDDPVAMYAADVLTVPASLAGLPAVSVPCGTSRDDEGELPVGLQLIGPREADATVLRVARAHQEAQVPLRPPSPPVGP